MIGTSAHDLPCCHAQSGLHLHQNISVLLDNKLITCSILSRLPSVQYYCSYSDPFCRDETGLVVTPLYGSVCQKKLHWSLLAFSLQYSSSSAFLKSLVAQSSHLSCGLPRFLHQPSCFFVSAIFGNLVSRQFHPALNYFANYTSFSSNLFS